MSLLPAFLLFAVFPSLVFPFRVAVFSDFHLNPFYSPSSPASLFCTNRTYLPPSAAKVPDSPTFAPLGRFGCDPPQDLIEAFFRRIQDEEIDALVMPGDFIAHKIAIEVGEQDKPELYEILKRIHQEIIAMAVRYLPNTILIPTLGNNDYKYHYVTPFGDTKTEFYEYLYQEWFLNVPMNLPFKDQVKDTFMESGYYKIKITDNVSVLGLNTLPMNSHDNSSITGEDEIQA